MDAYKVFLKKFLVYCLILFLAVVSLNYFIDPLQFYRCAGWYVPHYSQEQRYQNPGLARNYDYDTIIVGTSMTENFLTSSLEESWHVDALNLAISGSTVREQFLIANIAIKTGKAEKVFWGLDYNSLRGNWFRVRDDQGPFPYYLYDDNFLNDFSYLFNRSTSEDSLKIIKDSLINKEQETSLEILQYWGDEYDFGEEIILEFWNSINFSKNNRSGGNGGEFALDLLKANFEHNILSLVKENPDVQFIFFYPPYSIMQHAYWYRRDAVKFFNELEIKRYIFAELKKYDNVEIHDFQSDKNLTFKLDSYKDLGHYRPEYNEYIIESISTKKYLVTDDNIEDLLSGLKEQVESYPR